MDKIFLIPGLGADTRIYNKIDLPADNDVIPVDWVTPNQNDTLMTYAQRLINEYNIGLNSIVIGNSMGGMIAVEIAKQIPLKKVIIISSIKIKDEAPLYFKLFKTLRLNKIVPAKQFTLMGFSARMIFGRMSDEDAWLFTDMLKNTSPVFVKWALGAVLKWDNETIPPNLYHITGDKDLIFPYQKIKGATIIKGGTHIMVLNRAKEISKILKAVVKKK